ncbi:D-alanine--D-alanine ligase [Psychromonas antarctica]|uniref:D-alanine--D-alanine ligase n=1 Tax=Psychromonas antarctica TaxID=67573 RepID=UPI001EE7929B|nr:D-alanine--D-alanine ligase [Psychromonas antarctica]MCG6200364.1 D-alanine--D-alanine ligase [Psychromonas antarctica]
MSLNFGKVAVLLGGNSAEREVSLRSGRAVLNSLLAQGIDAIALDPKHDNISQLKTMGFDRAFIALHGRGGEDGCIQGFLTTLQIPFTGSDVLSSAIAMDKSKTKQIWQSYQLPTASYQIIIKDDFDPRQSEDILNALSGTVMVKPVNEGSSIGMAKVSNAVELADALFNAFKFDNKVLLESWIVGKEYTVSILNGQALPAIRMQTDNTFYDYQAKYNSTETQYFCPCGLAPEKLAELNELAIKAFDAIGCRGWGRIDFMLDEEGRWSLLEVNTVPGMTETSLVPKAAKHAGYDFNQLVLEILKQSLS